MSHTLDRLALVLFLATLCGTFVASYLGRRHSRRSATTAVSSERLNKWLVGLSGGATANSGFVVTGAVGLGYTYGAQWLLLPIAWMIGDVVFWSYFPSRLNRMGGVANASTLTDLIVFGLTDRAARLVRLVVATIVIVCLSGYVSAQWLAGEKFLHGAFGFGGWLSLAAFAAVIVCYTAIGGFRGSVYADSLQAILRLIGTTIALVAVCSHFVRARIDAEAALAAAGPDFMHLLPHNSPLLALGFVAGFACAALGFGLGQPQMVSRYLAGESPKETRAAWWIYMGFVQFTWVAMTVFGILLRGIMPAIPDPEGGLSIFFRTTMPPVLTGIIVADIFATIAATSNSLLVAMAQTVKYDLLNSRGVSDRFPLWAISAFLGGTTMLVASLLNGSVVTLALSSVSMMGAALAPAVAIRILKRSYSSTSLLISICTGFSVSALWHFIGFGAYINEAAPGMACAFFANYLTSPRAAFCTENINQ